MVQDINSLGSVTSSNGPVALGDGRALLGFQYSHSADLSLGLWVTDGTADGTRLVKAFDQVADPFRYHFEDPDFIALGDGRALFAANEDAHGRELWVSDGTAAGTRLVADIAPGAQGSIAGFARGTIALGDGRVLFAAENGSDAPGGWVWVSDGTAAGTVPLLDSLMVGALHSGVSVDPLG